MLTKKEPTCLDGGDQINISKLQIAYGCAILNAVIIGFSFLFVKLALEHANPIETLMYRFAISFGAISMLALLKMIKLNYRGKPLYKLLVLATLYPLGFFIFQTYGLQLATSVEAGILFACTPILTMMLASFFLRETTSLIQKLAIFLSVIGVILIFMNKLLSIELSSLSGIILLFLSGIAFAGYSVLTRSLIKEYSPMEITYFMLGIGFVVFLILAIIPHMHAGTITQIFAPLASGQFMMAIIYLSIMASLITALSVNYTLSVITAAKASVFMNLSTVVSIIAGAMIVGEAITLYHLIGSVLIITGAIGANLIIRKNKSIKFNKGADSHMSTPFITLLQNRRAVKHFDNTYQLSELEIKQLLDIANRAPSAWNLQHWKYIAINDIAAKKKLLPIAYGQQQIIDASVVIAVLGDLQANRNADSIYDLAIQDGVSEEIKLDLLNQIETAYANDPNVPRDDAIRNASLAAMQLLLAANAMGLDSCPMGGFDHKQFVEVFGVPDRYIPVMLITIGKAVTPARPSSRFPVERTIVWNGFE